MNTSMENPFHFPTRSPVIVVFKISFAGSGVQPNHAEPMTSNSLSPQHPSEVAFQQSHAQGQVSPPVLTSTTMDQSLHNSSLGTNNNTFI